MPATACILAEQLRLSLRGVATTVTIISTEHRGCRYGMVATSVMSVTLDPPALVVGINRTASIHEAILRRKFYCINVLSEGHESLSRHFSTENPENRFTLGAWGSLPNGESDLLDLPYLADAQAAIFCRLRESVPYGSHSLFVGSVEHLVAHRGKRPLLYRDGIYGSFQPTL